MRTTWQASACSRAVLGIVLLSALDSGCRSIETSSSHDLCYEHDGMCCRNYGLSFEGTRLAALAALTDLNMPVCRDGRYRHGLFIDTRTRENLEVRLMILPLDRQLGGTRICVRVGGFGTHRHICEHLLDEIAGHQDIGRHYLDAVPGANTPSPVPFSATAQPLTPSGGMLPPQPVPMDPKKGSG